MPAPADATMNASNQSVPYFAYGANMAARVLARRDVAALGGEAAVARGYRLRFSHPGLFALEPAFANLEPDETARAHGVLWTLPPASLARLDRLEGAEYRRIEIAVETSKSKAPITAWAYINPRPVHGLVPSRRYLRCLIDGAREHGLPAPWVEMLALQPSRHVPLLSDALTLLVGLAERLRYAGLRPEKLRMRRRGRSA